MISSTLNRYGADALGVVRTVASCANAGALELMEGIDCLEIFAGEAAEASDMVSDTVSNVLDGAALGVAAITVAADIVHIVKDQQKNKEISKINSAINLQISDWIDGLNKKPAPPEQEAMRPELSNDAPLTNLKDVTKDLILENLKKTLKEPGTKDAVIDFIHPTADTTNLPVLLQDLLGLSTAIVGVAAPAALPFLLIAYQSFNVVNLAFEQKKHFEEKKKLDGEIKFLEDQIKSLKNPVTKEKSAEMPAASTAKPVDNTGILTTTEALQKVEAGLNKSMLQQRETQLEEKKVELKKLKTTMTIKTARICSGIAIVAGAVLTLFPATSVAGIALLSAGIAGLVTTAIMEKAIEHYDKKKANEPKKTEPIKLVEKNSRTGFFANLRNKSVNLCKKAVGFFSNTIPSWFRSKPQQPKSVEMKDLSNSKPPGFHP